MTKTYCCYGAYADVGCLDDCPSKIAASTAQVTAPSAMSDEEIVAACRSVQNGPKPMEYLAEFRAVLAAAERLRAAPQAEPTPAAQALADAPGDKS